MPKKKDKDLVKSAVSRLIRIGGLVSRVGASFAAEGVENLFRKKDTREERHLGRMMRNAKRVTETLGRLKGGAMKLGQMLSLHEGLLPTQVTDILRLLQKEAPAIPFAKILTQIKRELREKYDLIESIDQEAYAAASIGQVHRAVLKDGREVVFKVQYPGIDKVIQADVKNLKGMMRLIFAPFTKVDIEPLWKETRERLLEELDYINEAANMREYRDLYKDSACVIIPEVLTELSTKRVLCSIMTAGIPPYETTSELYPQELRDRWSAVIFTIILDGIFGHRFLHADPNLANFSFMEDGRVIIYDFGCMKRVPETITRGYARLVETVLNERYSEIPDILKSIGIKKTNGNRVSLFMISDFADLISEPFKKNPLYTFQSKNGIYEGLRDLGKIYWVEIIDTEFPKDILFIHRTIGGHFGNLGKLRATGPWRDMLLNYIEKNTAS